MAGMKFSAVFIIGILTRILTFHLISILYGAEEIIVDENGNGDYLKVQNAIDNATEGEIIQIWGGNYTDFNVNKSLEIIGNGTNQTIVNCITLSSNSTTIMNISFRKEHLSHAIYIEVTDRNILQPKHNIAIINCVFSNYSQAIEGTAIYPLEKSGSSDLLIKNCTFVNCRGGIYTDFNNVNLNECNFQSCYYGYFGSISNGTISDCIFDKCNTSIYGFGENITITTATISNCGEGFRLWLKNSTIHSNQFNHCGVGLVFSDSDNSKVDNCAFINNRYGISVTPGVNSLLITNCTFHNNSIGIFDRSASYDGKRNVKYLNNEFQGNNRDVKIEERASIWEEGLICCFLFIGFMLAVLLIPPMCPILIDKIDDIKRWIKYRNWK